MNWSFRLLIGALVAASLAGCGAGEGTETVAGSPRPPEILVTLDARRGAENAGLVMAAKNGYFDDLGLNVVLRSPARPRRPVTYVADRTDEIGVAQLPQVVLAKEKGAPVVAVGSVLPRPTAAMIWLPGSGIQSIADLRGKRIAVPGIPYQEGFLQTVLERAGLRLEDVQIKTVGFGLVPALLHGRADAIFGGSSNIEGTALRSLGAEPVITRLQRHGIPAYEELVVLVRSDRLEEEPQKIRDFMAAVIRGTEAAAADPKRAAAVIEEAYERDLSLTPEQLEAQLKSTLPLLSKDGQMDPAQASGLVDWMRKQGQIGHQLPVSELLTNEYLPQP